MYRLGHSFVLGRAVAQPGLLEQVVRFKEKFYRTPWAKLADARPGTLRLTPPKGRLDELAADYASMRPMLFGSYPSIDEIVAYMAELEEIINGLSWSRPPQFRAPARIEEAERAARRLSRRERSVPFRRAVLRAGSCLRADAPLRILPSRFRNFRYIRVSKPRRS